MSRKSLKDIVLSTNLRCLRVYPVESTNKKASELNTIGIKLSKQQAIQLARGLLAASQDWNNIEITGYRLKRSQSDGTYPLTVTAHEED
jgi:hypothetical protein